MNINPPCLNCKDRYLGCHDHCNNYQTWITDRKENERKTLCAEEEYYGFKQAKEERIYRHKRRVHKK